jgi:hypothetical protein
VAARSFSVPAAEWATLFLFYAVRNPPMPNLATFRIVRNEEDERVIVPYVDGIALAERVESFEKANGFTPSGGYGGLIPPRFRYGPLDRYLLGETEEQSYWAEIGGIYVLVCECGEAGCWPLECRVRATERDVVWTEFRQPHRPQRDYSAFGPFIFDRAEYDRKLVQLLTEMASG